MLFYHAGYYSLKENRITDTNKEALGKLAIVCPDSSCFIYIYFNTPQRYYTSFWSIVASGQVRLFGFTLPPFPSHLSKFNSTHILPTLWEFKMMVINVGKNFLRKLCVKLQIAICSQNIAATNTALRARQNTVQLVKILSDTCTIRENVW